MNKELISVIVPVYNVEAFIDKCLNSILSQTYKNIEVVLVDDGSTDNSGKKCDEYVKKDSRVKVIHKSNGGLSSARNTGIDNSSGSFLSFIDSDDYIDSNMLEILYNGCVNNNCDIGIINKVRVDEFDNKKYDTAIVEEKKVKSEEALKLLLLSDPSACNKIYRRDLFNKIEFPIGKLYEDILTIPYLLMESKNIYLNPNFGYYYFQRSNSIVNSKFKPQKMDYLFNSLNYDFLLCGFYDFNNQSRRVQEKCGFKPYRKLVFNPKCGGPEPGVLMLLPNPNKNIEFKFSHPETLIWKLQSIN